jgi:hypothetical protein
MQRPEDSEQHRHTVAMEEPVRGRASMRVEPRVDLPA